MYVMFTILETVPNVLECSTTDGLVFDHGHRHLGFDKESTLLGGT